MFCMTLDGVGVQEGGDICMVRWIHFIVQHKTNTQQSSQNPISANCMQHACIHTHTHTQNEGKETLLDFQLP